MRRMVILDITGWKHEKVIMRSRYKERLEPYLEELLKECNYDKNN